MVVVFLGPPGSGKGTQAAKLRDDHGFTHFDTGAALRAEAASGSALGQRIASIINAGNLVPIEVIRELVVNFIRSQRIGKLLFDGFPRNLEQAEVLDQALAELGDDLDHAIYLNIDHDELIARIVNRRMCGTCGSIYNLLTNPPQKDGICDDDGGALVQREDDTEAVFDRRLSVYLEQTVPVLERYRLRGLLRDVDGALGVDEVTAAVLAITEGAGHVDTP